MFKGIFDLVRRSSTLSRRMKKTIDGATALMNPSTARATRTALRLLQEYAQTVNVTTIDRKTALAFFASLKKRGNSTTTINQRFFILLGFYNILLRLKVLTENPLEDLKFILRTGAAERPTECLNDDEVRRLLNAPDSKTPEGKRDRAILACLFGGGLRRSEVASLALEDVEVTAAEIVRLRLNKTKSQKPQRQNLPPWGAARVSEYLAQRKGEGGRAGDGFFITYFAKDRRRLSDQTINDIVKRHAVRVLQRDVSSHSGRVSAITKLLRLGVSLDRIKNFSRHATYGMLEVYDRRSRTEKDKIDDLIY